MSDPSPPTLVGAQQAIAEAFRKADRGLFVLDSVPGAGKSFVRSDLVAKTLLELTAAGVPAPTTRVAVLTFAREEAAAITTAISDRLTTLVANDMTPAATAVSHREAQRLCRELKTAPYIGTVDEVLRTLHAEIATDCGFTSPPAVGETPRLEAIHRTALETISEEPATAAAVDRLRTAYPATDTADDVADLLRTGLRYCRVRQCSIATLRKRLQTSVTAAYPHGPPEAIETIVSTLADHLAGDLPDPETVREQLTVRGAAELRDSDAALASAWRDRIEDFCTVLAAYQDVYDQLCRERGVIAHHDCAAQVADVSAPSAGPTATQLAEQVTAWFIDEAQDVSQVQHDALAPFVSPEDRVFVTGDRRQSIYEWRGAHPELFTQAITDGTYFGQTWSPHVVETARRTFRLRPALAAGVNVLAPALLSAPDRGGLGPPEHPPPTLTSAQDAMSGPGLHVASFTPPDQATPGTPRYVAPDDATGEAAALAQALAAGIADGTFAEATPIPVLFRRRARMAAYAAACADAGLTVANASTPLFTAPVIAVVCAVADWLQAPDDPARLKTLLTHEAMTPPASAHTQLAAHDWSLPAAVDAADEEPFLAALAQLRAAHPPGVPVRPQALLDAIADTLELWTDRYALTESRSDAQRVANLDRLLAWSETLAADAERLMPATLATRLAAMQAAPNRGPRQAPATADADVVFKTIFQMKGQEAAVVAIADLGVSAAFPGAHRSRWLEAPEIAALAPPTDAQLPLLSACGPYQGGVYAPAQGPPDAYATSRDQGLRWATERWDPTAPATAPQLLGPDRLTTPAHRTRAEFWRLLYVALTRAHTHLVLPLPRSRADPQPADRWVDALCERLAFTDDRPQGQRYTVSPAATDATATVAVDTLTATSRHLEPTTPAPATAATTVPLTQRAPPGFVPRMIRPATLAALMEAPAEQLLSHLCGEGGRLQTTAVDQTTVPFDLEVIPPEQLGKLVHAVVERVLRSWRTSQSQRVPPTTILEQQLDAMDPDLDAATREALYTFIAQTVLTPLAESPLRQQVRNAEHMAIEPSLGGHRRVPTAAGPLTFEFDAVADIVLTAPDGTTRVIDLKLALSPLTDRDRHSFQTQVNTYAALLADQGVETVIPSIQVLGLEQQHLYPDLDTFCLTATLQRLVNQMPFGDGEFPPIERLVDD